MAATNYTPIYLYNSGMASNVPLAANLGAGELAINYADGKLFYKDGSAAIQVIGWKTTPTSAGGTGLTSYTAGDTVYYASGTAFTKLGIGAADYVMTSSGSAPQWSQFLKAVAGGTGQTSYAVGDLLYANTTTTLAKLADVATGNALISGGVGVAPSYGKIGLTTHVSGVLPVANGGTNASTASITAFNNITGYSASGATGTTTTNLVFSTSPTLVTPNLGTPSALVLSNATGLPQAGLGTNVVGNGPAFRAYSNNSQSIASATTTKIQFNVISFDTNSNFDNTTNYRFTPTVAGYYQVNLAVGFAAMGVGEIILQINKNGSVYQYGSDVVGTTTYILSMATLVYMNGSTDYIEGFIYQNSGLSRALAATAAQCTFSGALVRSN